MKITKIKLNKLKHGLINFLIWLNSKDSKGFQEFIETRNFPNIYYSLDELIAETIDIINEKINEIKVKK